MRYFEKRKAEKERQRGWKQDLQRIRSFRDSLTTLGEIPKDSKTVYEYAVKFFDLVSRFQDEGLICNAPSEILNEQKSLNQHITNAGRCEYGINRTKRGEEVTLANTYWGNIFGLYTFTGEKWMQSEDIYEGFASQWLKNPSKYDAKPLCRKIVADFQVIPFLASHYKEMLSICDKMIA